MTPSISFAGFIITYQRSEILKQTLQTVMSQTVCPEKLWIIDNSHDEKTGKLIKELKDDRLFYYRTGYNAGPAGAAKIGLQLVARAGYEWIYWGDDNDPPRSSDVFEKLLGAASSFSGESALGQIGLVGQYFDSRKGRVKRVDNNTLKRENVLLVDTIAGGQSKIVNSAVVVSGVLPCEKLFFGCEELEFDIKLKKAGFASIARTDLFLQARRKHNRLNFKPVARGKRNLSREYYSTRNLLFILIKNKFYQAAIFHVIRSGAKVPYGFRYGLRYGLQNAHTLMKALCHCLTGKFGIRT